MCWFRRKDRSEKFYPYGFTPYGRRKMTRAQQNDFIETIWMRFHAFCEAWRRSSRGLSLRISPCENFSGTSNVPLFHRD